MNIYTDGLCRGNPGKGAFGFFIEQCDDFKSGYEEVMIEPTVTTNNKMELKAVLLALSHLVKSKIERKEIYLYSDSKLFVDTFGSGLQTPQFKGYLKNWLKNGWKTSKGEDVKNSDIIKCIITLLELLWQKQCTIHFLHVRGHSTNAGNNYIDRLLNQVVDASLK